MTRFPESNRPFRAQDNESENKPASGNEEVPEPGTVTAVTAQKKAPDRVSIFIDGEFAFGLHADILLEHPVSVGSDLSGDDIARLREEDEYYRARAKAHHLLAYRTRSCAELRDRLLRKGVPTPVVERVVERLLELELLNDAHFASEWAQARVRSRGYGPVRIRAELRRKGIANDEIEAALQIAYDGWDPEQQALEAARKTLPRLERVTNEAKRRQRLTAFLARRGFTYDQMGPALQLLRDLDTKE